MTVSTWFRGSGTPGNYKYLVAKGSNECSTASYGIYTGQNGGLLFYVGNGEAYGLHSHRRRRPERVGRQVAQRLGHVRRHDRPPLRRRQGDRTGSSRTEPVGYATPSGNTTLGAYVGSCDLTFTGDLDEVSIWKKALPIAEIWKRAAILLQPH